MLVRSSFFVVLTMLGLACQAPPASVSPDPESTEEGALKKKARAGSEPDEKETSEDTTDTETGEEPAGTGIEEETEKFDFPELPELDERVNEILASSGAPGAS